MHMIRRRIRDRVRSYVLAHARRAATLATPEEQAAGLDGPVWEDPDDARALRHLEQRRKRLVARATLVVALVFLILVLLVGVVLLAGW